jgi:hypothetical protein
VTAAQVRGVIERIIAAGRWNDGDPDIMAIFDVAYELAWLLRAPSIPSPAPRPRGGMLGIDGAGGNYALRAQRER